jgi:hypothetical protein
VAAGSLTGRLLWTVRLNAVLFAAVVVVQLTAAGFFSKQVLGNNRAQLCSLERQMAQLSASISAVQSPEQRNQIYRTLYGQEELRASITKQPMGERKRAMGNVMSSNFKVVGGALAQKARQGFIGLAVASVREVLLAVPFAVGCQAFAQ